LKTSKIHDTLKLHLFSVIYQKIMPNAWIQYQIYSFHETSSAIPLGEVGNFSGLTEARCRDSNVFLDSWLLHRGVQTIPGQKGWGQKVEKIYENKGGCLLVNQTVLEGILLMDKIQLKQLNSFKANHLINQIDPSIKSHHRH